VSLSVSFAVDGGTSLLLSPNLSCASRVLPLARLDAPFPLADQPQPIGGVGTRYWSSPGSHQMIAVAVGLSGVVYTLGELII